MARSLSVLKRTRQNIKKKEQNQVYKDKVKSLKKQLKKLLEKTSTKEELMSVYASYSSAVDKALKKNIIHTNTANRKKSRMNLAIKKQLVK